MLASMSKNGSLRYDYLGDHTNKSSFELERAYAERDTHGELAFHPNGDYLVHAHFQGIAGRNAKLTVWDLRTNRRIHDLHTDSDMVDTLALSPDGQWLAAGWRSLFPNQSGIQIWDFATGQSIHSLAGHAGTFNRFLAFTPEGHLLSVGDDQLLRCWHPATGTLINEFAFPSATEALVKKSVSSSFPFPAPAAMALSSDGQLLAVAGDIDIYIFNRG